MAFPGDLGMGHMTAGCAGAVTHQQHVIMQTCTCTLAIDNTFKNRFLWDFLF